jgi:PKD repeat protein
LRRPPKVSITLTRSALVLALLGLFAGATVPASAQTPVTLIDEHFETWIPSGWLVTVVYQGVLWRSSASAVTDCPNHGPFTNQTGGSGLFADANSDCIGYSYFDSTLASPEFSLADPQYTSASLVYKTALQRWVSWYATAEVGITTDGGVHNTVLLKYPEQNYDHRTETIDLTPYLGQAHVRIGFRYQTLEVDYYWQVDDVQIIATKGGATCSVACTASAPASGVAGTAVAFTSTATPSGCVAPPSFAWAFGDGSASTQQNPDHAYSGAGTYNWAFTASADGQSCHRNGSITITGGGGKKAGDCNSDGTVSITELQQVVNNQLGISTTGCGDCEGNGQVSITELQKAVNCQLGMASCDAACQH